jgi:hypothetical protein
MASSKPPKLVPRTQLPNPRPPGMLGVFLGRIETRTVLGTPLRPASQVIPPRRLLPAVNVVAWRRSNLIGRGEDTPQDALCQPANFGACISRYATRHQRHDVAECPAGMGQTPARRTNGDVRHGQFRRFDPRRRLRGRSRFGRRGRRRADTHEARQPAEESASKHVSSLPLVSHGPPIHRIAHPSPQTDPATTKIPRTTAPATTLPHAKRLGGRRPK